MARSSTRMRGARTTGKPPFGALLLAGVGSVVGCEEPPQDTPREPTALAVPAGWERVADVSQDVFGAERPDGLICDEVLGVMVERLFGDPVLEVDTGACDYYTGRQATLEPIEPGDRIAIKLFHYQLAASGPSEATLALAIDGSVAWERVVPIPSEPAFVEDEVELDEGFPVGVELQYHVHNHGLNDYELFEIVLIPGEAN